MSHSNPGHRGQFTPPASQALLMAAMDVVDVCTAILAGPELCHVFANGAWRQAIGRPDVCGLRLADVLAQAAVGGIEAALGRVLETGEPWHIVRMHAPMPSDPHAVWEGSATRLQGMEGEPCAVLLAVRNVRAQQAWEEAFALNQKALQEHSGMLHAISDLSPDAIFAKDVEGRIRFANPAVLRIIGKPLDKVLGRVDAEILDDPAAARRVMETDRRIMASGQPEEVEERLPMPDGTRRVWLSRKMPYLDEQGRMIGLLGISRDITERKRAEEALTGAHQALQRVLSSITDGLAVLDHAWRYTYMNASGARLLGVRVENLIGHSIWDLHPYVGASRFGEEFRRATETGEPAHFEEYYPQPLDMWLECHCYPWEDGLSVYFRDVTERKRAEAALRESDRRKSDFIAILSHELRNPLAPICNCLSLLDRLPADSAPGRQAIDVIRRQTSQLKRLVDDLLDVTRITSGKIELQLEPVNLIEVVGKACVDMTSVCQQARLHVHHDLPADALWVRADATRITQVFGNLVQNAVKFTPEGGTITAVVRQEGNEAVLCIRDTGSGMDPESIERMFEPFAQGEQGLARSKGGLGLGLALVKGLVEMHGGSVQARSDGPGRGAEFTVRLPLAQPEEGCAQQQVHLDVTAFQSTRSHLIVLIEDNADAAEALAAVIETRGHRVHVAPDGHSGVEAVRRLSPDAVVCDLGLPDIPGFEVARLLRSDARFEHTVLIALSGYAQIEDRRQADQAGFDHHMAKPADVDALLDRIETGRQALALLAAQRASAVEATWHKEIR